MTHSNDLTMRCARHSVNRSLRPLAPAGSYRRTGFLVILLVTAVVGQACAPRQPMHRPAPDVADRPVRVAIHAAAPTVVLSATSSWRVYDGGGALVAAPRRGERLTASVRGGAILLADESGREQRHLGALVVRPADLGQGALVSVNGRRYRGELALYPAEAGVLAVNHLPLEDYLRGVVPLEIGPRASHERAAVEAQAITARSYALVRLRSVAATRYDLVGGVMNQVYGGADAEMPLADEAVRATRGLVLTYAGRIVDAVYHSTCGGSTAAASEVWRSDDQPFLRAVSDRVPGTDRHYCDISPRFRWTREITREELSGLLARYLREYARVGAEGPGTPRGVTVEGRTPSGRVRSLVITTDRGRYSLRGNDIRFVLRETGGAILGSTYFSAENEVRGGSLARLTLLGAGFGHGVGMCQWGAIGRARAGQDFRTILGTYYPGTRVEMISSFTAENSEELLMQAGGRSLRPVLQLSPRSGELTSAA